MRLELDSSYGFLLHIGDHPIKAGTTTEIPDAVWDRFKHTGLIKHLKKSGVLVEAVAQDVPEEMPEPSEESSIASGSPDINTGEPTGGDAGSRPAGLTSLDRAAIEAMCLTELLESAKSLGLEVPKRCKLSVRKMRTFMMQNVR